MAELYETHPLYQELEAYAESLFQVFDEEVATEDWPSELDLDELERHLLDALSELALSLEPELDQSRQVVLQSLSYNNFGVALSLLRNILLTAAWQVAGQTSLARRLQTLWGTGLKVKQELWQELSTTTENLKLERKWKL